MKIKGNKEFLQSSLDFYLKLVITDTKTVEELRNRYFTMYLNDERENMRSLLSEKQVVKEEKVKIEEIHGTFIDDIELEEADDTVGEESIGGSNITPSAFLQSVLGNKPNTTSDTDKDTANGSDGIIPANNITSGMDQGIVNDSDDIVHENNTTPKSFLQAVMSNINPVEKAFNPEDEIHGIFLDEVELEELGSDDIEEVDAVDAEEYANHGIFLDDILAEGYNPEIVSESYTYSSDEQEEYETPDSSEVYEEVHGIFLDEVDLSEFSQEDAEVQDIQVTQGVPVVQEEIQEIHGIFLDEIDLSALNTGERIEEKVVTDEVGINPVGSEHKDRVDEVKKDEPKEEQIVVPSSIRQFIKEHPGSTIEFVLKYYSKKDIEKQLMLGKIYKKKGKLFI